MDFFQRGIGAEVDSPFQKRLVSLEVKLLVLRAHHGYINVGLHGVFPSGVAPEEDDGCPRKLLE